MENVERFKKLGKPTNRVNGKQIPPGKSQLAFIHNSDKQALPAIPTMEEHVLAGSLENLPKPICIGIRIFLSSTFTDFKEERNILAARAYPVLKEYCSEHNLDFQMVDMRWGVTDEASSEHLINKLCMDEIHTCQRLSFGPNFICLLGDRYGYQPIPDKIEQSEFEVLLEEGKKLKLNHNLLLDWYRLDKNTVPPAYLILPKKTRIKDFSNEEDLSKKKLALAEWFNVENNLRDSFHKMAIAAYNSGKLHCDRKHTYLRSVTESEIAEGILSVHYPRNSTLCYIRHLDGIENNLDNKVAARFTDVHEKDGILKRNDIANELLFNLVNRQIKSKLPPESVAEFTISWGENGIDRTSNTEHENYLNTLCGKFMQDVTRLISMQKKVFDKLKKENDGVKHLIDEIAHHSRFCVARCQIFCGRENELNSVEQYLRIPNSKSLLVIHAPSGSGKTSLMAKIAEKSKQILGSSCVTILRFLGTSSKSNSILRTLQSICHQIALAYKLTYHPSRAEKMSKVTRQFIQLLQIVSSRSAKSKPLLILLDSLDQLDSDDNVFSFNWLPTKLPSNVHIIVSTLPDIHHILDNLKRHLSVDIQNSLFLNLEPIPLETSKDIVEQYMLLKKRQLTKKQLNLVCEAFVVESKPLFLKLILDDACRWHSYTGVAEIAIAKTVTEAISKLFDGLEKRYGKQLVCYSLGYLTIGRCGLSEVEMEDALSCNDDVLDEVYQYHNPPVSGVVRIPSLLWSRIRHEISDYVVERLTDMKTTTFWYHRQFVSVAEERYANNDTGVQLHQELANLYLAGDCVKRTIHLKNRNITIRDADRQVTRQKMSSTNLRMLNSLLYHLTKYGDYQMLKEHTICNFAYLRCYIKAHSVQALLTTMNTISKNNKDAEVIVMRDFIRYSEASIGSDARALAFQVIGQLGNLCGDVFRNISRLCDESAEFLKNVTKTGEIIESSRPCLFPVFSCIPTSNNALKSYLEGVQSIMTWSHDNTLLVLKFWDDEDKIPIFKIVKIDTFSPVCVLNKLPKHPGLTVVSCKMTRDKLRIFLLTNRQLYAYAVQTGSEIHHTNGLNINHLGILNMGLAIASNSKIIAICGKERIAFLHEVGPSFNQIKYTFSRTVRFQTSFATVKMHFTTDCKRLVSLHHLEGKKTSAFALWDIESRRLLKACIVNDIVPKNLCLYLEEIESFVYSSKLLGTLNTVSCETMETVKLLDTDATVTKIVRVNDSSRALFLIHYNNGSLVFWDGDEMVHLASTTETITAGALLESGFAVSGNSNGEIVVHDVEKQTVVQTLHAHSDSILKLVVLDNYSVLSMGHDNALKIFDLEEYILRSHCEISSLELSEENYLKPNSSLSLENVSDICVSHLGGLLVTCTIDGSPKLWDLSTGNLIKEFHTENDFGCFKVLLVLKDHFVVCLNTDYKIVIWSMEKGKICSHPLSNHLCDAFTTTRDTMKLVSVVQTVESKAVILLSLSELFVLREIKFHHFFTKLERIFLNRTDEFLVFVFNKHKTSSSCFEYNVKVMNITKDDGSLTEANNGFDKSINVCLTVNMFCCDNYMERNIVCGCHGQAVVMSLADGICELERMKNNRQWLKHSSALYFYQRRKDVTADRVSSTLNKTPVTSVIVSSCLKYAVTGANDGSVILWLRELAQSGSDYGVKRYFLGHTAGISALAIGEGVKLIVSGSKDRTIRVWEKDTLQSIILVHLHAVPETLLITADQQYLVAKGSSGAKNHAMLFKFLNMDNSRFILAPSPSMVRL